VAHASVLASLAFIRLVKEKQRSKVRGALVFSRVHRLGDRT